MLDAELTPGARLVYLMLDEYARGADTCWPAQQTIATRLGISTRSVERHIRQLVTLGYIEKSRASIGAPTHYRMAARTVRIPPDNLAPPTRQFGGWHPTALSGDARVPYCVNTGIEEKTPLPPAKPPVSEEEFRELEEAYDRHLKHHRSEPRDTVLQMVLDQATRGVFDWPKFRGRHREWCARQTAAGWQYASLTFLGWIRAGYPPPAPVPIDRESQKMQNANELAKMLRGEK